jgi:phosphatidylserine/phosphatidylglycerophosphate/cardiolipin synthase-like enzyme
LAVIRNAQKYVVIVTPYLKLWGHAVEAFTLAVKNRIDIRVIVRLEPDTFESEDVTALRHIGVKVLAAPLLHAKIYMNEQTILVSSMNFTEFSTKNSLEIALLVQDEQAKQRIGDYVRNTVMQLAVPIDAGKAQGPQHFTVRSGPANIRAVSGVCIRCHHPIVLDALKPFCFDCYQSWAQWGNEDYPEVFCHC